MTNKEKYNLKKLETTNGLKIGDILGDSCVLGCESSGRFSTRYDRFKYTISDIDGNIIRVKELENRTFDINGFFLLSSARETPKETNHHLTKMFKF